MDIAALKKKAELNLLKKQTVCTDNVFKDMNYMFSMPLDSAHITKSNNVLIDNSLVAEERDAIKRDVRAPLIEITFDLQTDVHTNSNDPEEKAIVDQSYNINFEKV